ncbi:hypothetical protein [Bordetella sp. H567]|uniref:hypothetical protein n=1 Tax=Bordetella sp. H567 TaxID=1697043 RepID=UPI0011AB3BF1|nr:hypothetical protein [Bordetella sp. H567]
MDIHELLPKTGWAWALAIFSLFVAPTLGNLFYDYAAKPIIVRLARVSIVIFTFGLKRTRRRFFRDIATRAVPNPSVLMYLAGAMFLFQLMGGTWAIYSPAEYRFKGLTFADIDTMTAEDHLSKLSPEDAEKERKAARQYRDDSRKDIDLTRQRHAAYELLIFGFLALGLVYQTFRHWVIVLIIRDFDHRLTLLLPLIDVARERELKARFAGITDEVSLTSLFDEMGAIKAKFPAQPEQQADAIKTE